MRVLALDFETGGTDPRRHAPVSIGLALMEDGTALQEFESMIGPKLNKKGDPEREYDVTALSKSGASWTKIKSSPAPQVVWGKIADWLAKVDTNPCDLCIVAHNSAFDQAFWSELRFMSGWFDKGIFQFVMPPEILGGPWACTRRMASRLALKDETLDTVAQRFGLSRSSDKHGALEDAILAGKIYHLMSASGAAASYGRKPEAPSSLGLGTFEECEDHTEQARRQVGGRG